MREGQTQFIVREIDKTLYCQPFRLHTSTKLNHKTLTGSADEASVGATADHLVWWLFPRVRGFWEDVLQFIPRLRFFF